jgi:hypothetical protein
VQTFGHTAAITHEQYGTVQGVRAFYAGNLEVEFGLVPLTWANVPLDAGTRKVVSDGMRIL